MSTVTVHQAFGTKAAVLATALDQSVVGDWVVDARKEADTEKRRAIVVTNAATVAARTAPLKEVMRDAAATERRSATSSIAMTRVVCEHSANWWRSTSAMARLKQMSLPSSNW